MRFWLDCEFQEDGRTIDLISIGLVREDGAEYYAESIHYTRRSATPWLRDNVLPHLSGGGLSRGRIASDLVSFCGPDPEFWGWYGSYDWVCLCQIFGTMMDLPSHWPMFIREAMQWRRPDDVLPTRTTPEHHALWDAQWQREVWEFLAARESQP